METYILVKILDKILHTALLCCRTNDLHLKDKTKETEIRANKNE